MWGKEIECPQESDLIRVAKDFSKYLQKGQVCLLEGEMGSGKTFFTTHVYEALGGDPKVVSSPSYSLVNEYPLKEGRFYHVDLYRLEGMVEEDDVSQEQWMEPNGLSFVEWPGRFGEWRPERGFQISLRHLEQGRGVLIKPLKSSL